MARDYYRLIGEYVPNEIKRDLDRALDQAKADTKREFDELARDIIGKAEAEAAKELDELTRLRNRVREASQEVLTLVSGGPGVDTSKLEAAITELQAGIEAHHQRANAVGSKLVGGAMGAVKAVLPV